MEEAKNEKTMKTITQRDACTHKFYGQIVPQFRFTDRQVCKSIELVHTYFIIVKEIISSSIN